MRSRSLLQTLQHFKLIAFAETPLAMPIYAQARLQDLAMAEAGSVGLSGIKDEAFSANASGAGCGIFPLFRLGLHVVRARARAAED